MATETGRRSGHPEPGGAVEELRRSRETGAFQRLEKAYAPDALLDANVPQWRFERRGVKEIVAQYQDWYPGPARIVEWTETPTEFGAVVEEAEWTTIGAEEVYSRTVHLVHLDGGRIVRHVLYCTGRWDEATVQRQAREAPASDT